MTFKQPTSYLVPKLVGKTLPAKGGHGVFAESPIKAGELLVAWGGEIIVGEALAHLPAAARRLSIQIEENLFLVPIQPGPADYVNHSCDPNAGMSGQICLVALRDIAPGEEICYDYAMSDGSPYDEFECHCGAATCRGRVTGDDWQRPELWQRYGNHFSPYLQRRINELRQSRLVTGER